MAKPDDQLTERIIGCCFKVHKTLGAGFLEKVYENALITDQLWTKRDGEA